MQKKLHRYLLNVSVLASALAMLPLGANAAGLGKITVLSALGQPLRAEVELMATREELASVTARFASHDAFKQAGLDFVPALAGVKIAVDKRASGQSFIRLSSDKPVDEPFLDFLLELSWSSGRLVREYTFLLDPPPELLAPKPAPQVALPVAKPAPVVPQPVTAPVVTQPVSAPVAPEQRVIEEKPAPAKKPEKQPEDAKAAKGPVNAAKPAKAAATEGKTTLEVKHGDTLNKIAAETKPEGVSLDQMLVAIFQSNQDAFVGNVHRLKAGKILAIPERDAVAAVTPAEARRVISAHTADFNAYRQKLASAAGSSVAKEEASRQTATGKIAPKVEERAPAAEAKDQIKISRAESGKEAKAAQGRIAALEEDLTAKAKALKEAQSRQTDLEKNVKDLQKLLDLKNQNLAELQKQAAAKPAPAPVPVPEVKKPAAPTPEVAKPVEPAKPAEAPKPAEVTPPVAPVAPPVAEKPAEAPKATEEPKPAPNPVAKKPAAPRPPEEPDLIDTLMDNPAIPIVGLLILILGAYALIRRRRKGGFEGDGVPTTTANLATNSVFGATGGQSVDTNGASSMVSDFSQASISAIDAEEGVDPVAEADVYMAYGRDAQAEEILLDALKTDPGRTAIHVKLLEIFLARKNLKQFETLASDLYAQTGGVGADWEKAAAMGQKLDPANPLYGGGPITQGGPTDTTVIVPAGQKMHSTWTMPGELSQIAQAVEDGSATVILGKGATAAAETAAMPENLDFDLDLGTGATPIQAEAAGGLDFDLGLGSSSAAATTSEHAATAVDEGLHFDLDLGQAPAHAASAAEVIDFDKTMVGGSGLDFDFNLGTASAESQPHGAAPTLDLGDINLDLGTPLAADGDDVATKLELAKAYEEMGDKEGARELLQEVLKEGSGEQQEKARGILAKLS